MQNRFVHNEEVKASSQVAVDGGEEDSFDEEELEEEGVYDDEQEDIEMASND